MIISKSIGNNQVLLLAADGIWGQLMNVNPYWAGYCGVLVNVNDIAAMGSKPLAMVDILSIKHDKLYSELMRELLMVVRNLGDSMVGRTSSS